ncbi:MAG: S8 family serine peptidase [Chloroflexia bacterium]
MSTLSSNKIRFVAILAICVLAIGALMFRAFSTQAGVPAAVIIGDNVGKVAQTVLKDTENGQRTSFVILLSDQADLSKGYSMRDQDARGWYVYNTLRSHAEKSQASLKAFLAGRGVTYQSFWAANMLVVTGDRSLVEAVAARSDVRIIESNKPSKWIEDDKTANFSDASGSPLVTEWGVQNVNAPQVWTLGYTGTGMVVGNQDTGMRWTHNAIKPKYRGWNGATADHNYNWWDSIHSGGGVCGPDSPVPCDDHSHGTHTTGTTVGDDGAGNQIGVAPGAKWMGCRNMNVGAGTPATYTECFQFFIAPTDLAGNNPNPALRPHVMNNSWGCPPSEGCAANTLQTIVESSQSAGIFVVASAGNSGSGCSTVSDPPAIYAASFTVGSITISNAVSSFSSRGPVTVDGSNRLKPEIAAPGSNVRSATNTSDTAYANFSGTSMAGPHVVGVVALLWDAHPQLERMITETKQILQNTANPNVTVSNGTLCGGTPIPNNHFGYGRVDALAAVNSVSGGTVTPSATVPVPSSTPVLATPTICVPGPAVWVFGPTYTPGVYAIQGDVAADGNFYVAGGQDGANIPQSATAKFNPGTNTWTSLAPLPVPVGQAAVGITGTKMYVAGGFLGGTAITSTLQIYDITSNTWSFGPSMPAATEASAGVVLGNKFYVIGGDDFNVGLSSNYAYDVVANSWTTAASLPATRTNVNGTAVGGLVYLFGGAVGAGFTADDDLLSYNPSTNSWTNLAPAGLTDLGNYANISPYTAGKLIATVGGSTTFVPSNRTRIYDIALNSWTEGPAMNESRLGHAQGTLLDGRVIVVSGLLGGGVVRTSTELLATGGGSCPTPSVTATSPAATVTSTAPAITSTATRTSTAPVATNTSGPGVTNTATTQPVASNTPGSPTATATACTLMFTDVPTDHTFYESIRCLACRGIINGYSSGCETGNPCFRPGNLVTRGQLAKIVSNSAGFSEPAGAQQFEDVPPGHTFYEYIWRLADRGIINGYPCGGPGEPCVLPDNLPYFRPANNITRGQLSKIVSEAAGLTQPAGAQQFEDVPPGHTFYDYIWRLTSLGIMNGYPCGGPGEPCVLPGNRPYFRPGASATRGQASKIVANTFFPDCVTPSR